MRSVVVFLFLGTWLGCVVDAFSRRAMNNEEFIGSSACLLFVSVNVLALAKRRIVENVDSSQIS
jgi:hypothetical protein